MPGNNRTSGDLLADRRYAWAEGSFDAGDIPGAIDLAGQVIELVPGYAPAWILLGNAHAAMGADSDGHADRARHAFGSALALDHDDPLGARMRLAQIGGAADASALTPAYVAALFDGYASRFERHLIDGLGYSGPSRLRDAILGVAPPCGSGPAFGRALDLGCGTGLMGSQLAGIAATVEGVDLSGRMLELARASGAYQALHQEELVGFLRSRLPGAFDLVVAADVLVYLGDLDPVLDACAHALAGGGIMAFTLQSTDEGDVLLGEDGRYSHGTDHVRSLADRHGLHVRAMTPGSSRRQGGVDVPGMTAVLQTP